MLQAQSHEDAVAQGTPMDQCPLPFNSQAESAAGAGSSATHDIAGSSATHVIAKDVDTGHRHRFVDADSVVLEQAVVLVDEDTKDQADDAFSQELASTLPQILMSNSANRVVPYFCPAATESEKVRQFGEPVQVDDFKGHGDIAHSSQPNVVPYLTPSVD